MKRGLLALAGIAAVFLVTTQERASLKKRLLRKWMSK